MKLIQKSVNIFKSYKFALTFAVDYDEKNTNYIMSYGAHFFCGFAC